MAAAPAHVTAVHFERKSNQSFCMMQIITDPKAALGSSADASGLREKNLRRERSVDGQYSSGFLLIGLFKLISMG